MWRVLVSYCVPLSGSLKSDWSKITTFPSAPFAPQHPFKIVKKLITTGVMYRPPYIDPASGRSYDTSSPIIEGWLTKQSMWLKDWRRRYFFLKDSKLFFSKGEFSPAHGMIDLSTCMTVKSAELKAGKKNAIEVSTKDMTYYMYADSEKEKDEWIGAIGRSIVQSSATYVGGEQKEEESDEDSEVAYPN